MSLFNRSISKHQFKSLIKQFENLDYNGIINGLDSLATDLVHEEDERYFTAVIAIKKCIETLQNIYSNNNIKEE